MPETLWAAKKRAKEVTFSPDGLEPERLHPRFSRPGTANFLVRTKRQIFSTLQARRSCYDYSIPLLQASSPAGHVNEWAHLCQ